MTDDGYKEPCMNNEFPDNLNEAEIWGEVFTIRSKRTDGINSVLRRKLESDENMICVYLFDTRSDAIKYLAFVGKDDPDQWGAVSCKEFGGAPSFLKQASSFATHVALNPPLAYVPALTLTIEDAIRAFKSFQAKKSNSGGRQTPFWELLLKGDKQVVCILEDKAGVRIVPLFKTETDAEKYINSGGLSNDWEADGPVDSEKGIDFLEYLSSSGFSDVVINPHLSDEKDFTSIPIKAVIDHVREKGHIRDLEV
jgi:hypothetical protein